MVKASPPNAGGAGLTPGWVQGSPVWQALAGHKRSFPLAVVLPPPARGPGTLIPSAQRLVWAAKQPLGKAALGALFASATGFLATLQMCRAYSCLRVSALAVPSSWKVLSQIHIQLPHSHQTFTQMVSEVPS